MLKCMREDKLYCLGIATLAIAGFLLSLFLYWLLVPFTEVSIKEPFPVLNENHEVSRGEELVYLVEYEKTREIPTTANRYIECVDGNLVTLISGRSTLPKGEKTFTVSVVIPEKTSLGECVYVTEVAFELNPLKTVTKTYKTEPFNVVE